MTVLYVLIAILVLGVLIAVHEFGHYITARLTGIPVREFAIGMGPKLFSRTSAKTGIVYSLRAVPMGGFCAFVGEDDPEQKDAGDPRCWAKQKLWKRMLTVFMGPGMNFILAFLVMLGWLWIGGVATYEVRVESVAEGGPAAAAGFLADDVILEVNGTEATDFDAVHRAMDGSREATMSFVVRRGEELVSLEAEPVYDEEEGRRLIGITMRAGAVSPTPRHPYFFEAVGYSWDQCVYVGGMIFRAIGDLFRGQGLDQVTGPVGTVSVMTEQVRDYGFEAVLNLLVVISVNLGIVNLLPIPGLDGSRILFMLIEAVRRKPIPPEREAVIHLAGLVLLVGLMIFLTVRDVGNLFH